MKIRIAHTRLNGATVTLAATLDADGAILFWSAEDHAGAHVDMSSQDKWCAVSAMHAAVARMKRGAA